jgi:hypothetical protein
MAQIYNEHAGVEVTSYFEGGGVPTNPTTVHWRLDCVTTDTALIDWTEQGVSVEVDESGTTRYYVVILIPGSANVIQKTANKQELKEVTIVADKDQDREFSETYQYYVKNTKRS